MIKSKAVPLHLLVAVLATTSSFDLVAQSKTLEECQRIQDKIDYYTELRKRGGPAQQMEDWKQSREKYKDQFRDYGCRKYGKKIE